MVRIPGDVNVRGPLSVSTQPIREVLEIGQAAGGLIEATTQLTTRLAEAERAEELTQKSALLEGSLVDLQLEIAQNPDFNTVESAGQAFVEGAEGIFSEFGQSDSHAVSRALEKQFLQSSLRAGVSVKKSAFKRQADTAIAGLDAATESFERAYAAASDDEERERIRALHVRAISLSAYLSEQEKGDRIRSFDNFVDKSHVRGLIDAGFLDEAEDLLFDPAELTGMDELERQAMLRTLNTTRARMDRAVASARGDIEDVTAKDAFSVITQYQAGEGPAYTHADFERDSANLGFQDARTIHAAMLRQDITVVDDIDVISMLNTEIENGNENVVSYIHAEYRAGKITKAAFDSLLLRDRNYNDDPIQASPYKQAAKNIRDALGPSIWERSAGVRGDAVQRTQNAIDELDHFRAAHSEATPTEIRAEGARIRAAYQQDVSDVSATHPAPYSLERRGKLTVEDLDQAAVKLGDDYAADIIDDWVFARESENIEIYREEVERRNASEAAK